MTLLWDTHAIPWSASEVRKSLQAGSKSYQEPQDLLDLITPETSMKLFYGARALGAAVTCAQILRGP